MFLYDKEMRCFEEISCIDRREIIVIIDGSRSANAFAESVCVFLSPASVYIYAGCPTRVHENAGKSDHSSSRCSAGGGNGILIGVFN